MKVRKVYRPISKMLTRTDSIKHITFQSLPATLYSGRDLVGGQGEKLVEIFCR